MKRTSPLRGNLRHALLLGATLSCAALAWGEQNYPAKGLVLKIDKPHHEMLVSCQAIPGYMEAMVMPFPVNDAKELDGLAQGSMIEFTVVVDKDSSYASNVRIHGFQSLEQDPLTARRLALMNNALDRSQSPAQMLNVGQPVPDFTLIDQNDQRVRLSRFAGKVVAISFMYTRCPFPNYCFRLSNNFGQVQKRFRSQMGRDLILLSISFDPAHDKPADLTKYGEIWHADPKSWHLLTGPPPEVQRVAHMFGMDFWLDEGLMIHALHTVVIDRKGKLVANLEGNEFTASQLGDLIQTVVQRH
jgi:protein SCO1/2